jgi:hypothetical protein
MIALAFGAWCTLSLALLVAGAASQGMKRAGERR